MVLARKNAAVVSLAFLALALIFRGFAFPVLAHLNAFVAACGYRTGLYFAIILITMVIYAFFRRAASVASPPRLFIIFAFLAGLAVDLLYQVYVGDVMIDTSADLGPFFNFFGFLIFSGLALGIYGLVQKIPPPSRGGIVLTIGLALGAAVTDSGFLLFQELTVGSCDGVSARSIIDRTPMQDLFWQPGRNCAGNRHPIIVIPLPANK